VHETRNTFFLSQGQRCAAWMNYPAGDGPHPAVVLVHGFGATHDMRLDQYEQAFTSAGMVVLSFDFRHIGASQGTPRQLISIPRQLADIDTALTFLANDPRVDGSRIALWGTSMGATHVLLAAAEHPELAAAVVQCPVVNTRSAAFSSGLGAVAKLIGPITSDLVRAAFRLPRRYVPIVDEPGRTALMTVLGAKDGWYGMVPPRASFDNRVTASTGFELVKLNASRRAASVQAPLLVCVSDHETLMDPRIAARTAQRAPRGTALHYPADHFEVYHPPLVDGIIRDQVAFLAQHLRPTAISEADRD
jgi:dienelactone hydrolase